MSNETPRQYELKVKREMDQCVHFRGIQHDTCKADVHLRQLVGGADFGWARRIPCFKSDAKDCSVTCAKREFMTREQAEAEVKKDDAHMERAMLGITAAHEDAEKKGIIRGVGGASELPCPTECGGTLRYRVASINGHMHAACTTDGCLRWME